LCHLVKTNDTQELPRLGSLRLIAEREHHASLGVIIIEDGRHSLQRVRLAVAISPAPEHHMRFPVPVLVVMTTGVVIKLEPKVEG
jgi:hypothetical protein